MLKVNLFYYNGTGDFWGMPFLINLEGHGLVFVLHSGVGLGLYLAGFIEFLQIAWVVQKFCMKE